ncbi:cytochrome P450 [Annulohypoxylon nitens]|nr:cytochrome P450 [Annulohypoxylon nitens]
MASHSNPHLGIFEAKTIRPLTPSGDTLDSHYILRVLLAAAFIFITISIFRFANNDDNLPVANKLFWFEPRFFSRVRWTFWAKEILEAADKNAQGKPYKLAHGGQELVILPARLIPELNRLGTDVLDSRQAHSFTLLGHLTGIDVVEKTSYHVRMLLGRISPALPELFAPATARLSDAMKHDFPQSHEWTEMYLLPAAVRCFSEVVALALFGPHMAQDPRLVELTYGLTRNVFVVAFVMRCVPPFLHPLLVWLLPGKWELDRAWRELDTYVVPEVQRQKKASLGEGKAAVEPNLISWMVKDGRTELERDPSVLSALCGSVAAGSTYSIANFVCRALSDLAGHPDVLNAAREEIHAKHTNLDGKWDMAALASLQRLESAMKETARLAPGTLIVYSRIVQRDCIIGGVSLKKGQLIAMSGPGRAKDPAIFDDPNTYKGLRFCEEDKLEDHLARPFRSVDTDILTWGAGRWACPGRQVADMAAKVMLVKLLDEYDFSFVNGKPLKHNAIHEFLFIHPDKKILVRRREDSVGIDFSTVNRD